MRSGGIADLTARGRGPHGNGESASMAVANEDYDNSGVGAIGVWMAVS